MSNYLVNSVSPVIGAMVSKDKGDVSNRAKCAGEQMKNCAVGNLTNCAFLGAGGYAAAKVAKSATATAKLAKLFDKITRPIGKFLPKLEQKLANLPGKAKAIGLIALPVIAAVSYVTNRQLFKIGQTDQKYTDIAKIEKERKNVLA